jgi:hypothetical protein
MVLWPGQKNHSGFSGQVSEPPHNRHNGQDWNLGGPICFTTPICLPTADFAKSINTRPIF